MSTQKLIDLTGQLGQLHEATRKPPNRFGFGKFRQQSNRRMALHTSCMAFKHIVESNLVDRIFKDVGEFQNSSKRKFQEKDLHEVLEFFDTFLAYESGLFEWKNIPASLAVESFQSVEGIRGDIGRFITDESFRESILKDSSELNSSIQKIRERLCKVNDDMVWEEEKETRFILGGLSAATINTAADVVAGTMMVFNLISTAGGVVVAWRRAKSQE